MVPFVTEGADSGIATPIESADDARARAVARAWSEHAYSQLLQFRQLTLREKIEALEGMAEVAARVAGRRPAGAD